MFRPFVRARSNRKFGTTLLCRGRNWRYVLSKIWWGEERYGTFRRTSSVNFWRLENAGALNHPNLKLVEFDLTDLGNIVRLLQTSKPSEIYNLAAQSFVGVSFDQPITTAEITGIGAVNILEAIRMVNPGIRFYQASTSEMFGKVQAIPQWE